MRLHIDANFDSNPSRIRGRRKSTPVQTYFEEDEEWFDTGSDEITQDSRRISPLKINLREKRLAEEIECHRAREDMKRLNFGKTS